MMQTKLHVDRSTWLVCRSVGLSVCLWDTSVNPPKIVNAIEVSFWVLTQVGPRKHVLDGGVHWYYLANTTERSAIPGIRRQHIRCDSYRLSVYRPLMQSSVTLNVPAWKIRPSDAAFRQNSLTTCLYVNCRDIRRHCQWLYTRMHR